MDGGMKRLLYGRVVLIRTFVIFLIAGANGQQNYTVTIVANPNTAPYTVGDTLMLTCMVDPMPKSTVTYQWQCFDCFANGVTAQHITKVLTDMDNDMIDCSVTIDNMEYFNEMMFDLQVTQAPPPKISFNPPNPLQGAMVGQLQTVECIVNVVAGVNSVMVSWTGPGGVAINNNARVTISTTTSSGNTFTSSLEFTYLMEGDEGSYACNVTIFQNSTLGSIELQSLSIPSPSVIATAPNTQTVGQSLTLQCEVTTVRGITSRVDIVWSSGGMELNRTNNVSSTTMSDSLVYTDSYTIIQLSTTVEGRVIQCKVVINVPTLVMASGTVTLDVIVPTPDVNISLIKEAMVGSPQVISCTVSTVSGVESSSVTISWNGPGGAAINNDARVTIDPTTSSGNTYISSLQFTYLMEGDEGTYTCNVMILKTSVSQPVELQSLTIPSPSVITTTQTVGQSLTLQCEVTTVRGITSRVNIVWSSGGTVLRRMNDTTATTMDNSLVYTDSYTISQLSTTDEGRVIQCEGVINVNPLVTASNSTTLDVTVLMVGFASESYSGSESSGFIEVVVELNEPANITIAVTIIPTTIIPTVDSPMSTATVGDDFISTQIDLTINIGDVNGRANISVTCDKVVEGMEIFDINLELKIENPLVIIGRNKSMGQINDSTVVVNFNQSSYEVKEDNKVVIALMLSLPSSVPFQVTINTTDVTALDSDDYDGGMIIVNVSAGVPTQSFEISTVNSGIVECSETFNVTMISVTGCGVIIGNNHTSEVKIQDNKKAKVSLSQKLYSVMESDSTLSGSVKMNNKASENVTVQVTVSNESAHGGIDYVAATLVFNVTIFAELRSSPFSLNIVNDMIQEEDETFSITIKLLPSCVPLSLGMSSSTATIIDNDVAEIEFTSSSFSGLESSKILSASIMILNGVVSSKDINVTVTLMPNTANGSNDFNSVTQTATIVAGKSSITVNITIADDSSVEGNENFNMSLNIPSSLGPAITAGDRNRAIGVIIDTTKIKVKFTQTQYTNSEATGFIMVTLELVGGSSSKPFNVTVIPSEQSSVSAKGGVDFNTTTLTATFDSGMTMSSVSVPVIDDKLAEGKNKTFDLMLIVPSSLGPAITVEVNRAVGVIIDTTMLVVAFESEEYTGSELSGFVEVVVIISGGSSTTLISVMMTTTERTARGSGIDFDSNPINITFATGEVNKTVNIPVMCDKIASERGERFDIILMLISSNPQVRTGRDKSVGIIRDRTVVVNFRRSSYEVMEDRGQVLIAIRLNLQPSEPFEVMISSMDVTANDGEDYRVAFTTVSMAAGKMSTSFPINIINDNITECDETFKLTLSVPISTCGAVNGETDATEVTIKDNALLSFNQSQYSIEENITPLSVGLMLSRRASKHVMVEVTITDGSATAGIDYGKSSQSLVYNVTITAGMTSSSFDVDIIDNIIQDGDKMFTITIRLISTCLPVTINNDTTTVTIVDNEVLRVQFTSATYSAVESSGELFITIIITGGIPNRKIAVNVTFSISTATGNDFDTTPLIATIPAGATNTTVRVAVTNDNIIEGDEMFSMSLSVQPSSLGSGVVAGSITSANGTIIDTTDIRVRFTQEQYTGSEATGFVMVTLELVNGISNNPFSIAVTPSEQLPVSAEGGVDFDTTTLTATFDSRMTMSSVSVPVIGDDIVEGDESFSVTLSLSSVNKGITLGVRHSATVIITDSTVAARITHDPISVIVLENTTATLSCEAIGSGPIRYQWRRVNGEISSDRAEGVNTSTLTISPVQQEDEDEYYCVASYGVVNGMDHSEESGRAKITVFVIVQITSHPMSLAVNVNSTVNLSCEATGSDPIRYQWRRVNGEISSDRAEGVNTSTLTISPVQREDEDEYYCVASNEGVDGSLYNDTSRRAMITLYESELKEKSTIDCDCGNHTIGIAVVLVLLALAVVCIVGLVVWIVKLNKKLAQSKSKLKENHQNIPEPKYELMPKPKSDYVNMETNPSYTPDISPDHHYDVIPGSDDAKAKKI